LNGRRAANAFGSVNAPSPASPTTDPTCELERLRSELAAEREARLAAEQRAFFANDFIENGTIGLHWVGPDGTILWANTTELEMLGYAREEYLGHSIAEFHADQDVIGDILCRLGRNETLVNYEARLRCKSGELKVVLINSNVLWRDGKFVHTRCFTRDVTDIKRQAMATRESEERYRALVEQANDAIFLADSETGVILEANQRAAELIGLPVERLKGMHQTRLHPPERLEEYGKIFSRHAGSGGGMVVSDIFVRNASGADIPVEISASVIALDGKPVVQGIFRDVTERVRFEAELAAKAAELARSNAELETFAATASHDLQEPLRMIASYASLLDSRHSCALDERARGYLKHVTDAAVRMQNLVKALLAYAKVGQGDVAMEPVTMLTALREAIENLDHKMQACRASVSFDDLPIIPGNRVLLVQLFQNLLDNAMKFCEGRDPSIRIEAKDSGSEWLFAVADNGIGMHAADAGRVFKAFLRLHGAGKFAGTGLGLATCKKIAELHGGRIWVESTPGVGSIFFFTLAKGAP
jgi:PAS domain S-box-containing protein